jgi:hypothetical protein
MLWWMYKKILYLVLSLAAVVVSVGCVKNGGEVCYSGLFLHYHYDLNPEYESRFGSDVDRLTILVYDSADRFYGMWVVDDPRELTDDNLIHLDVPDGVWSVVTWGGDLGTFELGLIDATGEVSPHDYLRDGGTSTLAEHRLWIKDYTIASDGSKLVTGDLSRLYYGFASNLVTQTSSAWATYTEIHMIRNTNTLAVRLSGLPPDTRAHEENIVVHADMVNGRCRADNEICNDARNIHYEQRHAISSDATSMGVDLNVMRIFTGDEVSAITVSGDFLVRHGYPGGRISIPIVPTIMEHPDFNTQEDLDRGNHYEFLLDFDSDMRITVTINGWKVRNVIVDPL